ncbi:class I SAM-dependent methyltransferase [Cyclobacteriaceae bacterium YHN15]|nr:class I SAM-dependent methyltransferase [Cyclobacteriaceae bacterium YHN15]
MKNLKKHLQEFGFKTELSGLNDPTGKKAEKFYKTLKQYLGPFRFEEYLDLQDSSGSPEDESKLMKFIGKDETLFRLLLSFQIEMSEEIFKEILSIVKALGLQPKSVLELGGANGWALDYLADEGFDNTEELIVLDSFPNWTPVSEDIKIISSDYFTFNPDQKFDLIFSILGFSSEDYSAFVEKSISMLADEGFLILGLRISNEKSFDDILDTIYGLGCHLRYDQSKRIQIGQEQIPVLTIQHGKKELSPNEKLRCIRKGFYNLDNPKRIIGYEARIILDLIASGKIVYEGRNDWEDGSWMRIWYIEFNGITYQVLENFAGDLVVEFPVSEIIDIEDFLENLQLQTNYFSRTV